MYFNEDLKLMGITCIYNPEVVLVRQTSKLEYCEIKNFCEALKASLPYKYLRSARSWAKEITAHKFLYELGLFTDHTVDTDIDESERAFRLFAFNVIYAIVNVKEFFKDFKNEVKLIGRSYKFRKES